MLFRHNIKLQDLNLGMKIAEPVYAISDETGQNILVVPEDVLVSEKIKNILIRQKVKKVVVYSRKKPVGYVSNEESKKSLDKIRVKPMINEDLRKEAIDSIRSLFSIINDPENDKNMTTAYHVINGLDKVINRLVAAVTTDPQGVIHIHDLKRFDEYTYHHSLSVGVLSIAIGQALGMDLMGIVRLSRCAVLHDVGKLTIPLSILNKRTPLTKDEFRIMKDHAAQGYLNLKNRAYGDTELWNSVMFHHEKVNGQGYPKGLKKEEIPLFSRIISVADVYDAITSYRPYREPMNPTEAYSLMMSEVGKSFDYEIVKAFLKRLTLYPINSVLELSDNRIAVVVENENSLRPVVRIRDTGNLIDLSSFKNLNITITRIINPYESLEQEDSLSKTAH